MARTRTAPVPPYEASKKDSVVIGDYQSRYVSGSVPAEKQSFEKLWFQCLSFYAGNQWVRWNATWARLEEPPAPPWRKRYTANLILPMVMRVVAKLTSDRPQVVTVPNTPDRDDLQAARVSSKILDHLMSVTDFDTQVRKMVEWATICGTGFLKVYWDPMAGPRMGEVMDFAEAQFMRDSEETKESSTKRAASVLDKPIGEIRVDPISPFKIFTDAMTASSNWDDATYVIEATERSLDYIRRRWPSRGALVSNEDSSSSLHGFMENKLSGMVSGLGGGTSGSSQERDSAGVVEMWDKPSEEYPRGRCSVVANGIVLVNKFNAFT